MSEAGSASGEPILRVEALGKSFGGLRAVNDLSFEVRPGTITSLIGGNGAGKTTAFNLITGYLAPDAGAIHFRSRRVDGLAPHEVARAGIARGFQELRLFNRLSARDNIEVAVPHQQGEDLLRALVGGARVPVMGSPEKWLQEKESAWGKLAVAPVLSDPTMLVEEPVQTLPGDYRGFYANVRDAILGTAPLAVTPEDGFRVIRLLELARESSAKRCTIKVDF